MPNHRFRSNADFVGDTSTNFYLKPNLQEGMTLHGTCRSISFRLTFKLDAIWLSVEVNAQAKRLAKNIDPGKEIVGVWPW